MSRAWSVPMVAPPPPMSPELLQSASILWLAVERTDEWVIRDWRGAVEEILGIPEIGENASLGSLLAGGDLDHLERELARTGEGDSARFSLRVGTQDLVRWVNATIHRSDSTGTWRAEILLDRIHAATASIATDESSEEIYTAITERADFHRTIVETVNDGILVNDPSGRLVFVNRRLADLLGYRIRELLGLHLFDLMDAQEQLQTKERLERRKEGEEETFDVRFVHRNGSFVWMQASAQPLLDAGGTHLGSLVALADISPRKEAEGRLRDLLHDLEDRVKARTVLLEREVEERIDAEHAAIEASRAKSAFLANMSHELRTPLNIIMGNAEILQDTIGPESRTPLIDRALGRIHDASEHLLDLIGDVLDLSRIEAGKMGLQMKDASLGELLREVGEMVQPMIRANNSKLVIEDEIGEVVTRTDRLRVRQILLNGLSNASKFTEEGSICLRATLIDEGDHRFRFDIIDSGIGIDAATLEKLFSPFTQEDETHTRVHGGAGLGLSLSRRLAEMLGGELRLESERGVGTTFTLLLPEG